MLNVTVAGGSQKTRIFKTPQATFEIHDHPLGTEKTLGIILRALLIRRRLKNYDAVITSEYFACFAMNLRLILTQCGSRHVTIGLNQSRKILKTGLSLIDAATDHVFRRSDLFFVHSLHEISLFRKLHRIASDKFCFLLWGFDLPEIRNDRFAGQSENMLCMIGRNNRDIETFARAVDGLKVAAILITSRHNAIPADLPANVQVHMDLSMEDCLSCIKNARANLILVKDDRRGAGHITAVAAMMLSVPQIVSDARVLNDYFFDGYNCIRAAMGDVASVRLAIEELLANSSLGDSLAENGRDYASRWLTHRAVENRTYAVIGDLLAGRAVSHIDSSWEDEAIRFRTAARR
ncbi:glycosyltransferase [Tardiphaga robiniae]|uniref:Glycosyltransferase n=1 Tax=Tardiphaga robiniae TaxID=943830 RepID=A0A7G6TUN3_9BRAD|nr:glycosyltransferase [Tardiphaga robiniae]QND70465.1 glycosyltransferase [Tardiphaga robiniae]